MCDEAFKALRIEEQVVENYDAIYHRNLLQKIRNKVRKEYLDKNLDVPLPVAFSKKYGKKWFEKYVKRYHQSSLITMEGVAIKYLERKIARKVKNERFHGRSSRVVTSGKTVKRKNKAGVEREYQRTNRVRREGVGNIDGRDALGRFTARNEQSLKSGC